MPATAFFLSGFSGEQPVFSFFLLVFSRLFDQLPGDAGTLVAFSEELPLPSVN